MFFAVLTKKAEKSEANHLICLSAFHFVVPFVAPYLCGRSPRSFRLAATFQRVGDDPKPRPTR